MIDEIYRRSPVAVQNVMATAFGVQQRVLRHGGRYQGYVRELNESQWWSRERLQADQDRRLRSIISFCASSVPYYRDVFRALRLDPETIKTVADLPRLPLLEKETVREAPERFVPDTLNERRIRSTTGGTTGTPLTYYVTPSAVQYNYATYESRMRQWAGVRFGQRMATVNGRVIVPMTQPGPPYWRSNLAFNQLYLSAYHLTPSNLPLFIDRLARFRPDVIVGYVSAVHTLARFLIESAQRGRVSPKSVLVSSETLFPWVRDEIESGFGCRVVNGYSLGELTAFISECPSGSLHVSPEYGVVETLEIENATEIVATGLFNRAMPLVRYRTRDTVTPAGETACPCHRQLPVIHEILGRVDDQLVTPEGSRVGPAALSLAFQNITGVREAQIVQTATDEATVYVVPSSQFGTEQRLQLEGELRKRLGESLRLSLVDTESIPLSGSGKRRLIVSSVSGRGT